MLDLLRLLINPAGMLLVVLFTWVGTSTYHGITKWIDEGRLVRRAVEPWERELGKRDLMLKVKDHMIQAVSEDKDNAQIENEKLRAELEKSEASRRVAGAPDCVWSADDRRMLNSGVAPRRTSRH